MNTPIVGQGFGNFSRVLGPWTDYSPTDLTKADGQFGLGIGTQLEGGSTGAIITSITIEPPMNIVGTLLNLNWKLLVFRGALPGDIYSFQRASRGWPRFGDSDSSVVPLWSKMFTAKIVANNFAASVMNEHFPFADLSGPSVDAGEIMTAIFFPLFNETGASVYGVGNQTYTSLTVNGVFAKRPDAKFGSESRSIPRGRISGV